jgi:hypothetical protein
MLILFFVGARSIPLCQPKSVVNILMLANSRFATAVPMEVETQFLFPWTNRVWVLFCQQM